MDIDYTIAALLDLNGTALYQEAGYWIFIEARVIDASKRVLGMDNAHRIRKATAYGKASEQSDHIHKADGTVISYTFINAAKLLKDFFDLADAYMKETH